MCSPTRTTLWDKGHSTVELGKIQVEVAYVFYECVVLQEGNAFHAIVYLQNTFPPIWVLNI